MVSLRSGQSRAPSSASRRPAQNSVTQNPVTVGSPTDTNVDADSSPEPMATNFKAEPAPRPRLSTTLADRGRSVTAAPPETQPIDAVGRGIKELVHAINKIEQLGIAKVAGSTPKIVVIGDQSAGKSSVINAISGIQVPRSTGTCTRCPMKITLTADHAPGARWRCEVTLRREYAYMGENVSPDPNEKPPPFYPWLEKDPEVIRFKSVHKKDELQEVIFYAQLATLNPQRDPMSYVSGSQDQTNKVEFSPNLVCLDISAPELPDLAFFDLPGVIAQTEDKSKPYLIKLVKRLVKKYISEANALVLQAVSMEGDIQNSSAAYLANKAGASNRCIGILTKPDRADKGNQGDYVRWLSILQGKLFALGYGYHVVKNPSQQELDQGMTHAEARHQEKAWFQGMYPWRGPEFRAYRDRFGTEHLQEKLSHLLASQILDSLPTIHKRVQDKLAEIDIELSKIPEPPTNDAQRIVHESLGSFISTVTKQLEGELPSNDFRKSWKKRREEFSEALFDQRPKLVYTAASDGEQVFRERAGSIMPNFPGTPQTPAVPGTPRNPQVIDLDSEPDATPSKKRKKRETSYEIRRTASSKPSALNKRFTLEAIRSTLNDLSTSDIPGDIDPKAVNHMRLETLKNWDQPMAAFLDGVLEAIRDTIKKALDATLQAWNTTELYTKTKQLSEDFVQDITHQLHNVYAPRALRLERCKPMTENFASLKSNEEKELEIFQEARWKARTEAYFNNQDRVTGKTTQPADRQKKMVDEHFRKSLGPDPFAREVEAMSKIRGYYTIASTRFVDHLCQSFQADVFEVLRCNLHDELVASLEIYKDDGVKTPQKTCMELLEEDEDRAARRRVLNADREKLDAALKCLQELDEKYQSATNTGMASVSGGVYTNGNASTNGHSSFSGSVQHSLPQSSFNQDTVMDEDTC
ncbi:uncharacterized protein K452DRAFT_303099 [Aplosporella prunicola CBS 121167]|uniref:GED domain-containing protein n=1 Tax=Aplosporella prunicola CBS 121167 TaxID=1176127 RepID=A0A6A6AXX3_9PEZI|nr:uncharacterized protein K452DRAFT_303099 [Aplosporella prunicola CBS 121167]KAF2136013.1 hypothetical protein K452DRAFT_303099 [Aplosporella prunicola CBS 121167]